MVLAALAALAPPAQAADPPRARAKRSACVAPSPSVAGAVPYVQDCADTPELVPIPAGAFRMGDLIGNGYEPERPVRSVRVEAFLIGRTEVTVAQWAACTAAGGCSPASEQDAAAGELPVTRISWDEAQRYTAWLAGKTGKPYRLLSEAEWEYAARAGSDDQFTWGPLEAPACHFANLFDQTGRRAMPSWTWAIGCTDGHARAAPVGSYPSNRWGVFDMLGNVWEWVADCWHPNYEGAPADAQPWSEDDCGKRINRGGGWGNHPRTARVSSRDADPHAGHSDGLGFRVARAADPPVELKPPPAPAKPP